MQQNRSLERGDREIPSLHSFIVLRCERFSGFIFNPYLGAEKELDPVETRALQLCTGANSAKDIGAVLASEYRLQPSVACRRVRVALQKLSEICGLAWRSEPRKGRTALPSAPEFPGDGPYLCAPKSVVWEVTHACNLNCLHCLTSSGKPLKNELDTRRAFRLIDQFAKARVFTVSLSGGEPLLRPDILDIIRYATDSNLRLEVLTNGVSLPARILRRLDALPVFQVQVSIDGIGETHDRFRGKKGAFRECSRSARRLKDAGIAVAVSTTATSENIGEIDRIIDLSLELGCQSFKAILFQPSGRGIPNADRLKLDGAGHMRLSKLLCKRGAELQGRMTVSSETTFAFLFERPPRKRCADGPMGCAAGYDTLCVGPDATAYPCPFLHAFPLGNLLERDLADIWRSAPVFHTLRGLHKNIMGEPCRTCEYASTVCRGGCRAAAYSKFHDLTAHDPNCFLPLLRASKRPSHCRRPASLRGISLAR